MAATMADKTALKLNRKLLESALKRAAPFSGKEGRSRYGLLRCTDGLLEIICTDGYAWCQQSIQLADGGDFPSMCVEAATLLSLVSNSVADDARFAHDGSGCVLHLGRSRYVIRTASAQNFPMPTGATEDGKVCCAATDLKDAVTSVAFAAEQDSQAKWETGIMLLAKDGQLDVVAGSGGRSLLSHRAYHGISDELDFSVVAPRSSLLKAVNGLPSDGDVLVQATRSQVVFSCGTYRVWLTLLDVAYPDWKRPLFKDAETTAKFLGADLQRALRAAAAVVGQQQGMGSFIVNIKVISGGIQVASTGEAGDTLDEFDAEITGQPCNAVFGIRSISEVMSAAGSGNVTIQLQSKLQGKGALFGAEDKPSWRCVTHQVGQ